MSIPIISRAEWGAKPPSQPLTPISTVDGWIVHYVGGASPQNPTYEQGCAFVRQLQAGAMSGANGETYIDIPYNFLIDLNGRVYEGRGWDNKNAANGSANYNAHTWTVCVCMGPANVLTDVAKTSLLALVQTGAERRGGVSFVKGHRDVYATACPGDACYAYVPYLNDHLHDAPPTPVDWAALAQLAAWQKRVAKNPLREAQRSPDVSTLKALLIHRGYTKIEAGELYGSHVTDAVADLKRKWKWANKDGGVVGGPFAQAILTHP